MSGPDPTVPRYADGQEVRVGDRVVPGPDSGIVVDGHTGTVLSIEGCNLAVRVPSGCAVMRMRIYEWELISRAPDAPEEER